MIVYRIVAEKYADKLTASGRAGRWNLANEFILYTASTRSLATLELLVNRSGIHPESTYKVMLIEISDTYQVIKPENLPKNWREFDAYHILQNQGSDWYKDKKKLILSLPSAVIPQESNFLINTQHKDFLSSIHQIEIEDYFWDKRL